MVRSFMAFGLTIGALALGGTPAAAGNGHGRGGGSVCDGAGLIGSAYAACHTYCESLDCDAPGHSASDRACERALARFLELADGAQPPCLEAEVEATSCPCAPGWKDLDLADSGWEPSGCDIYDTGEGSRYLVVYGSDPDGVFTQLSITRYGGTGPWFAWAGAACQWSGSNDERGNTGMFSVDDQVPATETPDLGSYSSLYVDCLGEIEDLLERFDMSLEDCVLNPTWD
jgi:hypothetical protein